MEIDNQRYTGFHPYKIDPKFRVSIQSAWRPEAGEPLYLLLANDLGLPLVRVLDKASYDFKVKTINDSGKTPLEKGKLLVPKDLSEQAGIQPDSEVMLAGRGMNFEIWDRAIFDQYLAKLTGEDAEDDLGIF